MNGIVNRVALAILLALLGVAACGDSESPPSAPADHWTATVEREDAGAEPHSAKEHVPNALIEARDGSRDEWDEEERRLRERYPTYNGVSSWACWGMPGPPRLGRVLAVDNGANVCVTSYGAEDGVEPGDTHIVSRGGKYIATIQITDVRAEQSAGHAVRDNSQADIRRGDKVKSGE